MTLLGLSFMWWALLASFALVGALFTLLFWIVDWRRGRDFPVARTMTARRRRAMFRERLDINPALRGRR